MSLGWEGAVTVTFLGVALIIMGGDWVGPDIVFTILLAFLTAFHGDIITVAKAAAGYANTGLLTVIFLYMVAEGVYQTGGLEVVMVYVLGRSRSPFWAIVRLMIPVMFLSAFLNNTPVVALLTPIVLSWSRRCGVPAKKLLIPLAYASVLGGTCTLIGTSTNLVVSGLQQARYDKLKRPDEAVFKFFDIAPYGIPYAVWGFLFVALTQRWLLPSNRTKFASNLLVALGVPPSSPVNGKTLLDSGLREQQDIKVEAVKRKGQFIAAVQPDFVILEGDIIYLSGDWDQAEFVAEEFGLHLVNHEVEADTFENIKSAAYTASGAAPYSKLVQVTVAKGANIIDRHVSEIDFRSRFHASIVAVKRGNGRKDGLFNDIVLAAGDVLVLDVAPDFDQHFKDFTASFTRVHFVKDGAAKEFVIGLRAVPILLNGVIGKTVTEAGLRGIPGLYVLGVDKALGQKADIVDRSVIIEEGDILWVSCSIANLSFITKYPGFVLEEQRQVEKTGVNILYRTFIQVAVAHRSAFVNRNVRDINFRKRYKAAVVAVHREGARVPLRVEEIPLQAGDVLLVEASPLFLEEHKNDANFVMASELPNSNPPKKSKMLISGALAVGMVLTQIIGGAQDTEYIHLWPCAVLTAGLMLITGCMSGENARKSILWEVYLTIAAAFGVSAAMEGTGVAESFAQVFIDLATAVGGKGAALTAIYVATALLSEILTNNAAGAIMYPIASVAGDALGVSPRDMSIAIMLGASAGFINPFSYQVNLMVYTSGNYKTLEFAKVGAPFQIYLLFVAAGILFNIDQWHQVWIVSFICAGAVIGLPLVWSFLPSRWTIGPELWFEAKWSAVEGCFAAVFAPIGRLFGRAAAPVLRLKSVRRRQNETAGAIPERSGPVDTAFNTPPNGSVNLSRAAVIAE